MYRNSHTFRSSLLTLMSVALILCGCSSAEEPAAEYVPMAKVSFQIVAPKAAGDTGDSDDTWHIPDNSDDRVIGNTFDNLLIENQVAAYITSEDCSEIWATLSDLTCIESSFSDDMATYDYVGRIPEQDIKDIVNKGKGKLHFVANAGSFPVLDGTTIFNRFGQPADFKAIPMWGFASVDFPKLDFGERLTIGKIHLLRAMSKVEIVRDDDTDNLISELVSVSLNYYNNSGYLLPTDWNDGAKENTLDIPVKAPRIPNGYNATGLSASASNTDFISFYLPETINEAGNEAKGELTLSLTYRTIFGQMFTDNVYFRNYADGLPSGNPFDINRNHIYRFTVNKTSNLSITLDLRPYKVIELNPGFGGIIPEEKAETTD